MVVLAMTLSKVVASIEIDDKQRCGLATQVHQFVINRILGPEVRLISSAGQTALEVGRVLSRRDILRRPHLPAEPDARLLHDRRARRGRP